VPVAGKVDKAGLFIRVRHLTAVFGDFPECRR
jgi:hypothetical protein